MKLLVLTVFMLLSIMGKAQDSLSYITYSKVFIADLITKQQIYDRAMIWFSKAFVDSKGAINVKEKESGIIAGKATYKNMYKSAPKKKKDSTEGIMFYNYKFDWLFEVKEGKARISITQINVKDLVEEKYYPVIMKDSAPYKILFQFKAVTDTEYLLSKKYFVRNMDLLMASINEAILKKEENW